MGSVVPGSRVPGGTHKNPPYLGSIGFRVPSRTIKSGFQWVPGSRQIGPKWVPMGSRFRVGTQKAGSSGFRVPSPTIKSGFQWVPGSRQIGSKWVPVGSGFRVGTQKAGSSGFRVPDRNPKSGFRWVPGSDQNFFCADPCSRVPSDSAGVSV